MKRLSSIILSLLFAASLFAQEKVQVPDNIKAKFNALYPSAQNASWSIDAEDDFMPYYEIEFTLDGFNMEAVFDEDGELEEVSKEITSSELPKAALDYINKNYAGFKITESEAVEIPDGELIYEVELENSEEIIELCFDSDGSYIDMEFEESEEEELD